MLLDSLKAAFPDYRTLLCRALGTYYQHLVNLENRDELLTASTLPLIRTLIADRRRALDALERDLEGIRTARRKVGLKEINRVGTAACGPGISKEKADATITEQGYVREGDQWYHITKL